MRYYFIFLVSFLIFNLPFIVYGINSDSDTIYSEQNSGLRIYKTMRLTTEKPTIDGVLNDACWETGEWAGNYTQWVPNEGAKPTYPTYLKVLYDDKNIYVAMRAVDYEPDKILRRAGRRDEWAGDAVGICFDSYFDHRTGFEFDVTAAGQKIDLIITNPWNADHNWNAVWTAKVGMEDSCWVAEYEIPLSQLRYSTDKKQVWGMHAWRWIDRLQEESDWEPQSSTSPGMLYLFGELHGIENIPKYRHIEIMPYTFGKLNTFEKEPDNPFAETGRRWSVNAGIDAKIGITSNFTADLTINPDFGQVESDPSEMNLTAFETRYDEKRPFFLEGKNIFNFELDNEVNLFYTRRIGHSPAYEPELDSNEYLRYPENTTILSAVKVSGKTANGFSLGVLQSTTANEYAIKDSLGEKTNLKVEPLTSYTLARIQQDFKEGNTMLGGIFTATNRGINNVHLEYLNREAYTGGVDLLHHWKDKEFYVDAKLIGSMVEGAPNAMINLQESSARYYQRADAKHIKFDSTRNRLSGYGGKIRIGKVSKGLWRYFTELNWRSPGLELNDLGFMHQADIITQKNSLSYFVNHPVSVFRTYSVGIEETNKWDFGGRYLFTEILVNGSVQFLNKWSVNTMIRYTTPSLDTRILRGGEAMKTPEVWFNHFYFQTDYSKKIAFSFHSDASLSVNKLYRYYKIEPTITVMPVSNLKFYISGRYENMINEWQYINTKTVNNEYRYILGKVDQRNLNLTFRVDYIVTPELSIQYYGSPFASVGKYSKLKQVTDPKAKSYKDRYNLINPELVEGNYEVSESNDGIIDYTFENPDFDFSQFRSNLVFRWEYRPGSHLYLVWSHEKTYDDKPAGTSLDNAFSNMMDIVPFNIFLIKFNYWFSL